MCLAVEGEGSIPVGMQWTELHYEWTVTCVFLKRENVIL